MFEEAGGANFSEYINRAHNVAKAHINKKSSKNCFT